MKPSLKDKNILYLVKTMDVGGAERFTFNLCQYFSKIAGNITVFSAGGLFEKDLNGRGIVHIKNELAKSSSLRDLPKLRSLLRDMVNNSNFDIIHCQHRIFVSLLNSFPLRNAKVIYTAHNYFSDIKQRLIFPDFAVAISPIIGDNLKNTLLIKKERISIINHGISIPERVDYARTKHDILRIGFIGRIIKEKGIFNFLEAVKMLYDKELKFAVVIKGIGEDYDRVSDFINVKLNNHNVSLSGPQTGFDDIYKDIDILVLPSEMNEGLPLSILEAIARNIIVVTSNKGAIPDIIKDGYSGFILEDNSPAAISKKLQFILKSYPLLSLIKENGLHLIQEFYSLDSMHTGYQRLYLNAINI